MRVLLLTGESRREVGLMVGLELVAEQFDTVAAAVEECDAAVATGVMPAGGWR